MKIKKQKKTIREESIPAVFMKLMRLTRPNILFLSLSGFFVLIASLSQGLGLGLIIPVLNSLVDKSGFLGVLSVPALGNIISLLPFAHSNVAIFLFIMFVVGIAVIVENLSTYLGSFFIAKVSTKINHTVRTKVYKRYLGLGQAFFDKQKTGVLLSILNTQCKNCGLLILSINQLIRQGSFTIIYFSILLLASWKLTIIVFILLLMGHGVTTIITRKIKASAKEHLREDLKMSEISWNVLANILLTKIQVTEKKEEQRYTAVSSQARRHRLNIFIKANILPRIIDILNSTGIIILVCISGFFFMVRKEYSLGRFLVYFVALRRLSTTTITLVGTWGAINEVVPKIRKVLWVFDNTDKTHIKSGNIIFDSVKKEISFKNVCFKYIENIPILRDITFNVKKGKMLAIVGPTGAGKSSIVNLIPRFYEYDFGAIEINGVNIRNFDLKSLRKKISLVSQDTMVMNDTIGTNIAYGLGKTSRKQMDEVAKKAYIYDFIMNLPERYDTLVGDRGVRLSGGEKQRVSIARAILKNPDILILDEATSALDSETEKYIQKAIENLVQDRTVFVIAHRLSTIKNADWILVIEHGQIVEQGEIQELLEKKKRFHHYWQLQKLFY